MRFTRGPEPRPYIGGFHHLRRVFTHPHLWVGFWQQQRAQRCERSRPADAALASGAGDAGGARDAGAAAASLAPAGPTGPPAPPGPRPPAPDPRRADRGTDCDGVLCAWTRSVYCV